MGAIEPWHLVLLIIVILLVMGPGKLPQVGKGLGEAMHEFRRATQSLQETPNVTGTAAAPAQTAASSAPTPQPAPDAQSGSSVSRTGPTPST